MLYKRNEAFRFHFPSPLTATFKILQLNNLSKESNIGLAQILDVSPNGVRMKTSFNLPVNGKKIMIEISFKINEKTTRLIGELIWKRQEKLYYIYGLIGRYDEETKLEIIEELKVFSKKSRKSIK